MQQYYMDRIKKNISQIKKSKNISLPQNVHEGIFSISDNYPTNRIDGQEYKSSDTKDVHISGNKDHVIIRYDNDMKMEEIPWERPPIHTKYIVTGDTNFYENYVTDYPNEQSTNDWIYQLHGLSNGQTGYVHEYVIWDEKLKQYKTIVTSPSFVHNSNNITVEKGSDNYSGIIDSHCFYDSSMNNTKLISQGENKKVASNVSAPYEKSEHNNREKLHTFNNSVCRNKNDVNGFFDQKICSSSGIPFSNCVRNVSSTSCYERRGCSKSGIPQRGYDPYGHPHPSGHIIHTNCSSHILGENRRNYTGNLPNSVIMNVDHSGHTSTGRGIFREASLSSCTRRDVIGKGILKNGELKTAACCLGRIVNSDRRKHITSNDGESLKKKVHYQSGKIHFSFGDHKSVVEERLKSPIEVICKKPRVNLCREHCREIGGVHSLVTAQDGSDVLRYKEVSNHSIRDNGGNVEAAKSHQCLGKCFANRERQFLSNKKSISSTRLQEPHVFYPKKVSSLNANAGFRNNMCGGVRKESVIAPNVLCWGTLGETSQKGASENGGSEERASSQNGAPLNNVLENNRYFISSFRPIDQGENGGENLKYIEEKDNQKMYNEEGKKSCLNFPLQGISICKSKRGYSQNEPYEGGKVGNHKLDIVQNASKENVISYMEKGSDRFEGAELNLDRISSSILKGNNSLDDTSFSTLGKNYQSERSLNVNVMDNCSPPCVNCINKTDLMTGEKEYIEAENHTKVFYKESNIKMVEKVCNINEMGNLEGVKKSVPLFEETNKGEITANTPTKGIPIEGEENIEGTCTDYEEGYDRIQKKNTYDEKVTKEQDTLLENYKYEEEALVEENHEGTDDGSNFNYIEDDSMSRKEKKKLEKKLNMYFRKEGLLRASSNSLPHDSEKGQKDRLGGKDQLGEKVQPGENDLTPFFKGVRNNSVIHSSNRKSSITEYSQMENYDISSSSVDIFDDKEIKEVFEEVTINRSIKSSFCISRDDYEGPRKESMDLGRDFLEGEIHDGASAKERRRKKGKGSLPSLEDLFCKNKNVLFMDLLRRMNEKGEEGKKWNKKEDELESKLNRVMLPSSEKERNLIDKIIYCLDPSYVNDTVDEEDKWRQKLNYMRDKFLESILCVSYPIHLWNEETFEGYLKSLNLNALFDDTFIKYESDLRIDLFHPEEEVFSDVGNIGEGGFGVVTKMRFLSNPQYYAIKKISKEHIIKSQAAGQTYLEAKYHSVLSHVNIIKMYGCMQDNDFIYHVLEFCAKGSIYSISKNFKRRIIPDELAYKYFCHVVNGLYYLNQMGIFHRDIKMENVLVDHMDNAKLSDFGLSAMILGKKSHSALCGTLVYFSPEITSGSGYDWRSDIWSLGVLLYEMLVGDVPFDGTKTQIINSIFSCNLKFPDFVNPLAIDLIKKALVVDVDKRIKLCDISSDPWMQEMWKLSFQKGLAGIYTDSCYDRKEDNGDFNFIGSLLKAQCFLKSSLNASLSYPIRGGRDEEDEKEKEQKELKQDVQTERGNDNVDALIIETQQKLAEYLKVENFYKNEENVPSSDCMSSHQSGASFSELSESSTCMKKDVMVARQQWNTSHVEGTSQGHPSAASEVVTQNDLSGTIQEGSRTSSLSGPPHEDHLSVKIERDSRNEVIPVEETSSRSMYPKRKSSLSGSIRENTSSSNDDIYLMGLNWKTQSELSNGTGEAELVYSSEGLGSNMNQCRDLFGAPCVEKRPSEVEPERDCIEGEHTPWRESASEYFKDEVTPKKTGNTPSKNTIPDSSQDDGNFYDNSSVSNIPPCPNSSEKNDRLSSEVEEKVPDEVDIESLEKLVRRRVDNGKGYPGEVLPICRDKYTRGEENNPVKRHSISIRRGEARKSVLEGAGRRGRDENIKSEDNPSTRRNIQPSNKSERLSEVRKLRKERKLLEGDETYIPISVIKEKVTESSGESNDTIINLHVKDTPLEAKHLRVEGAEPHVAKTSSIELSDGKMEYRNLSKIEKAKDKNSETNKLSEDARKGVVVKKWAPQYRSTSERNKSFEAQKREDTLIKRKVEKMLQKTTTGKLCRKDSIPERNGSINGKKNSLVKGKDKTNENKQPEKEKRRSRSNICDLDGSSLYDKYIERINKLYLSIKSKKYLNNGENRETPVSEEDQASAATNSVKAENEQKNIQKGEPMENNHLHESNCSDEMEEGFSTRVKRKDNKFSIQQDKQKEEMMENKSFRMRSFHLSSYPVETGSSKLTESRRNVLKEEKNSYPKGYEERLLDEKSLDKKLANIENEVSVMMTDKENYRSSYKSRKEKSFLELKKEIMNHNIPNVSGRVTPDFFAPDGSAFNSSGTDGEEKSNSVGGVSGFDYEGNVPSGDNQNERNEEDEEKKMPTWYYEKKSTFSSSNSDYASDKCFYRRYKQNRTIHVDTSQLVNRGEEGFRVVHDETMDGCIGEFMDKQVIHNKMDSEFTQCSEFSKKTHHGSSNEPGTVITHPDEERKYMLNRNGKYQRAKSTSRAVQKGSIQSGESSRHPSINNKVTFMHFQSDGRVGKLLNTKEGSEEDKTNKKEKEPIESRTNILASQKKGTKELSNLELISRIRQKNKTNLLDKVKKEKCASNLGKRKVEKVASSGSMKRSLSEVAVTSQSVGKSTFTGRSDLLKRGSSKTPSVRDVSHNSKTSDNRVNIKSVLPNSSRRNNSLRNNSIEKRHSLEKEVMQKASKVVRPTATPVKRTEGKSGNRMTSVGQKLESVNSIDSKSGENKKKMVVVAKRGLNSSSNVLKKNRENVDSTLEKGRTTCDGKTERKTNNVVSPQRSVQNLCLKKMTEGKVGGMTNSYLKNEGNSSRRDESENSVSEKKTKSKEVRSSIFLQNDKMNKNKEETTTLTNDEASNMAATNSVEGTEEQVSPTTERTKSGASPVQNGKKILLGNNLKNEKIKQYLKSKIEKVKKENEYGLPLGLKTEESLSHAQGDLSHGQENLSQDQENLGQDQENLGQDQKNLGHTNQYDPFEGCTNLSTIMGKGISFCRINEVRRSISEIPFNCCVKHYFEGESNGEIKTGKCAPKGSSQCSQSEEDPRGEINNLCQRERESGYSRCKSEAVEKYNWTTGLDGDLLHMEMVRNGTSKEEAKKEEAALRDNGKGKHVKSGMMKGSSSVDNSKNVQSTNDGGKRNRASAHIYTNRSINLSNVKSKIDTNIYRKAKSETENVNSNNKDSAQIESDERGEKVNSVLKKKQNMSTYKGSSILGMDKKEGKKKNLNGHSALGVRNVTTLPRLNSMKANAHCSNSRHNSSAEDRTRSYQEEGGPIKRSECALLDTDYEEELQNKLLVLNKRILCGGIDERRQNYGKEGMKRFSKERQNHVSCEGRQSSHRDMNKAICPINDENTENDQGCNWGFSIPIYASNNNGKSTKEGEFIRMKSNVGSGTHGSEVNCLNSMGMGMSASGWRKCEFVRQSYVEKDGSNCLAEPVSGYCMHMGRSVKKEVQGTYSRSSGERNMDVIEGNTMVNTSFKKLGSTAFSSNAKKCVEDSSIGRRKWVPPPRGLVTKKESPQERCVPHGRSASGVGDNHPTKETLKRNISCGNWSIMQCVNIRGIDAESSYVSDMDEAVPYEERRNKVANLKRDNIQMNHYMKGRSRSNSRNTTKGGLQPVSVSTMQKSAQVRIGSRCGSGNFLPSRPTTPISLHKRREQIGRGDQEVNGQVLNKSRNMVYGRKPTLAAQQGSIKKSASNNASRKLWNSDDRSSLSPKFDSTRIESSTNCFTRKVVVVHEDESRSYTANCAKGGFFNKPSTGITSQGSLLAKSASNCVHMDTMRRKSSSRVLSPGVVNVTDNSSSGCFLYKDFFHKEDVKSCHGDSRPGGVQGTYERVAVNNRPMDTPHRRNGSAISIKRMGNKTGLNKEGCTRVMPKGFV
ncbi:serine/threonine protein kinase, putative [Plasmodium knowlesi strain H]|uniref:Serine/threonine protein kinase, putative n=3 Tax=Plasmodium knowlesi TaxID=5850 RepID=A0A5K1UER5_PLAKH|nr:aurora-related kinase 3, putative [Plasmodium knowlesi strain H]OTN64650.1 putative Ser/Thr protein kinase [Plasmodium knowlesi]CAA9988976.1 aurora-related kinase 3, putative [Plasmodium knowlesi strain H]SBO24820.1 serine/threonine protein kinase, putative [Plasmodium knowlesi strain H]SBO28083.1 serine/threonine protein kinase, putative [Plasmodium knowlesi strain H]VVS78450.1 aurora-related kinase 3, putative [Plasmodium knowlesi strain H]|eukprot:XP_002261324.1 Ser/Thr protein kinase, putative [Plasmodium knowlesi strain H]